MTTLAIVLFLLILDRCFPLPLPDASDQSVIVTAADGTPLRAFAGRNGVWRYPVAIEDVSPLYVQAVIGYEDRWYWRHPGVNPFALLRAAGQWLVSGHVVSGGSTLSMQVARILEPQPRSLFGKTRQVLRALQLEAHLSKREILTIYLNHAPGKPIAPNVKEFLRIVLSKQGQELVAQRSGFLPLPAHIAREELAKLQ